VPRDVARRGHVLVSGTGWQETAMVTVRLAVLSDGEPIRTRRRVRFHLGTAEVFGRVVVLDGQEIAPGEEGWAQLRLEEPIVARALDRFVLRAYSPVITIAGGTVIEPHAPKRRRMSTEDRSGLAAVLSGTTRDALEAALAAAGFAGVDPAGLAVRLGRTETELATAL